MEQVVHRREDSARFTKQLDLVAQAVGHGHLAAGVPEALADPVVQVIVQDDEIAHVLVLGRGRLVELRAPVVAVAVVREQQNQALNVGLNQVDRRGFERLQEAARQAEANHVVAPELASTAGDEADGAGVGEGPRIETRHQ